VLDNSFIAQYAWLTERNEKLPKKADVPRCICFTVFMLRVPIALDNFIIENNEIARDGR